VFNLTLVVGVTERASFKGPPLKYLATSNLHRFSSQAEFLLLLMLCNSAVRYYYK